MAKRPTRVLVLGATGHVGQAVVRLALEHGHQVTAATRRTDPPALRGLSVNVAPVDEGHTRLTELASGQDIVVDAAAPYPLELSVQGSTGWRMIIDAALRRTGRLLDAARRSHARLAFISSYTTLPRHETPLRAMEAAWRRSVYPYFDAKAAMEQAVLAAAAQGLAAVVVNPAACLGPWEFRSTESSFVRLVLARRLPVVMDQTINVIDVREVAAAIGLAISGEYFGRPIPLAGHDVTVAELAGRIAAFDGMAGAPPLAIDPRFASLAAFWTGAAFAAFGRTAPDPWRAAPLIADGFSMRPSPEQIAMGLRVRPLCDTLRDAVAFHLGWRGCGS